MRYLWRIGLETLRSLVPVRAHSLRRQLYFLVAFVDYLAETEVGDFDFAVVEDDVLGLQVVVDDLFVLVVQVLQATQDLRYYQLGFLFGDLTVLFQVEVEVRA